MMKKPTDDPWEGTPRPPGSVEAAERTERWRKDRRKGKDPKPAQAKYGDRMPQARE